MKIQNQTSFGMSFQRNESEIAKMTDQATKKSIEVVNGAKARLAKASEGRKVTLTRHNKKTFQVIALPENLEKNSIKLITEPLLEIFNKNSYIRTIKTKNFTEGALLEAVELATKASKRIFG